MRKVRSVLGSVFLVVLVLGCSQATGGPSGGGGNAGSLNGKVRGINFSLKSTTVAEETAGSLTVYLWGQNATASVGPSSPTYPYVVLTLSKSSSPKTYAVTTYGVGYVDKPGIRVTGWITATDGTWYDSGDLIISKLDLAGKTIAGEFRNLVTNEATSSLNGTFTATIP